MDIKYDKSVIKNNIVTLNSYSWEFFNIEILLLSIFKKIITRLLVSYGVIK